MLKTAYRVGGDHILGRGITQKKMAKIREERSIMSRSSLSNGCHFFTLLNGQRVYAGSDRKYSNTVYVQLRSILREVTSIT